MYEVGAEILVIPDGLSKEEDTAFIALQVTPSRQTDAVVNLKKWPSHIAKCARHMVLRVGQIASNGTVECLDNIPCKSALDSYHFSENADGTQAPKPSLLKADELWAKVFAVDDAQGFEQLFIALNCMHDDGTALANAEVLPSRTADLQLFWKLKTEGNPDKRIYQTADQLVLWGKICYSMEYGPTDVQQKHLNKLAGLGTKNIAAARQDQLRKSLQALLFPRISPLESVDEAAKAEAAAAEMFHEYARGLQRPRADEQPPDKDEPNEDTWQAEPVDIAARKLSTLLSLPSLATYLNLGVEIAINRQRLLKKAKVYKDNLALAVQFVDSNGEPLLQNEPLAWTACALDTTEEAAYFIPRAQGVGARPKAIPLVRGLVRAGAKIDETGLPRFRLAPEDIENMTRDRMHAWCHGDPAMFAEVDKVKRIAGLVVYDSMASDALKEELAMERATLKREQSRHKLNWAEDLLRGLRPDFALSRASAAAQIKPNDLIWRSISQREIHCEDDEFDEEFRQLDPVKRMLHRDHGLTQVPLEEIPSGQGRVEEVQQIDELFIWQGENIGIARNLKQPDDDLALQSSESNSNFPPESIVSLPTEDLGLKIRQTIPKAEDSKDKMLPLREGKAYAVGMRAVFACGVSLPLDTAVKRYSSDEEFDQLVLGDENISKTDGKKAVRLPTEDAGPPGIHLHWKDALVRADQLREEVPGENITTIVVRDGRVDRHFGKAARFITPPRVPFDLAEKQGQFDRIIKDEVPPGALSGHHGLWRFGPDGALPEARFGLAGGAVRYLKYGEKLEFVPDLGYQTSKITVLLADQAPFGPDHPNQSRGTVAILGRQGIKPGRFYPHRHAAQIEARMKSLTYRDNWGEEKDASFTAIGPEYRTFWDGDAPSDARPLFLELVPVKNGERFLHSKRQGIDNISGRRVHLPTLRIELGKGEVWQLMLNAYDEINAEPMRGKAAAVRLVHAVKKPLGKILFGECGECIDVKSGTIDLHENRSITSKDKLRLGLNAVTVSVSEADGPPRTRHAPLTWAGHVERYAENGQDMLEWDSQEGGDTTFIVGRLALDRKSSGNLRIEAEWDNYDSETVTFQNGEWIRNPSRLRATLMAIEIERNGHPAGIDLLQKGQFFDGNVSGDKLRGQTYAVPKDGQLAREYTVKLVTGTAFKDYYRESETETLEAESKAEEAESKAEITLRKKCTFRPPPPRLAEIETRLYWSDINNEPKTKGRRRSTRLRIRLDEKWFVSGKGEKLGIVLRRSGSPLEYASRFAPFLTTAGADPTIQAASDPDFLNVENFQDIEQQDSRLFDGVDLFLPEKRKMKGVHRPFSSDSFVELEDQLTVDILALTPQFNQTDGLYCDIEVRLNPVEKFNPYNAFVHLGLVRFQDNAVKHLRASFPLKDPKTKFYLLPDRELRVMEGKRNRKFRLSGSGYRQTENGRSLPVLNAKLMKWNERTERWVLDREIVKDSLPEILSERTFSWEGQFRYTTSPYVLLFEEFEQLAIDNSTKSETNPQKHLRLVYSCMFRLD